VLETCGPHEHLIRPGICAKLRTVAASNNRDHPTRSLYYCLLAPHTYIFILRAHPVRGESHNQRNTTGEVATLLTDHCFSKAIYEQARSIKGQYPPIFCALKFFSAQKLFYVVCFKHILKTIRFPP